MGSQKILAEVYEWYDKDGSIYYGWRIKDENGNTIHGVSGYGHPAEAVRQMNESSVMRGYESKCAWNSYKAHS